MSGKQDSKSKRSLHRVSFLMASTNLQLWQFSSGILLGRAKRTPVDASINLRLPETNTILLDSTVMMFYNRQN
jgi:hypothetical protein